eukprot:6214538-Pleurochrysis_carterae.AAC.1
MRDRAARSGLMKCLPLRLLQEHLVDCHERGRVGAARGLRARAHSRDRGKRVADEENLPCACEGVGEKDDAQADFEQLLRGDVEPLEPRHVRRRHAPPQP